MSDAPQLEGRTALVTGASQGLGKAIARQFLQAGASVALCARTPDDLFRTRDELAAEFPTCRVVASACDVSDEAEVNRLAAFALSQLGSVKVLVLNAGVYGPMGAVEEIDLSEWRRAIDINLYGVLLPCRALIPQLKKARGGKIIVISGGGATNPLPQLSAYAASKAAVVRLAETLAEELLEFGIDVNAIAPGPLKTRLVEQVLQAGPEKVGAEFFRKNQKWSEDGATPLEVGARLAVYLASAASNGITGKLLSAPWDPWERLQEFRADLAGDIYTLRRIVPKDRGKEWGNR